MDRRPVQLMDRRPMNLSVRPLIQWHSDVLKTHISSSPFFISNAFITSFAFCVVNIFSCILNLFIEIHAARPHSGQIYVAGTLRALLHSDVFPSEIAGKFLNIVLYHPIPVRFESNVSALSELSINCTMACVADR